MHRYSPDVSMNPALKELPPQVVAQTGLPLQQHITVDVKATSVHQKVRESQLQTAMVFALQDAQFINTPKSWEKALKSDHRDSWLKADAEEDQRMKDFGAYTPILISEVKRKSLEIGHLLRVLRVKPDEFKVRWVYDEARAGGEKGFGLLLQLCVLKFPAC